MLSIVKDIAQEFKSELQQLYGDELLSIILFGSHARGDFQEESDIDFAIVLKNKNVIATDEIFKITPISSSISLKYSRLISFLPVPSQKFNESRLAIYRFIKTEGIVI